MKPVRPGAKVVVLILALVVLGSETRSTPRVHAQEAFDYQRSALVPEPGWVRVRVTMDIASKLRPGWPDLMVFDPQGAAVQYALLGAGRRPDRAAVVVGAVEEVSGDWRLVLDAGEGQRSHHRLVFSFANRVAAPGVLLEASSDGEVWREIATADVYRLGDRPGLQQSAIEYPATRDRYLRLTWPRDLGLPELERIQVVLVPEAQAAPEIADLQFRRQGTMAGVTMIIVAPPAPGLGVSPLQLEMEPSAPVAFRLERAGGPAWQEVGAGMVPSWGEIPISSWQAGGGPPMRLALWSATGAAVNVVAVRGVVPPRYIAFRAPRPGTYTLRYGSLTTPGRRAQVVSEELGPADGGQVVSPGPASHSGGGSRLPEPIVAPGVAVDADAFALRGQIRLVEDGSVAAAVGGTRLARLTLPPAAYAATVRDLRDLRVALDGRQVPFILRRALEAELVLEASDLEPEARGDGTSVLDLKLPGASLPLRAMELLVPATPFRRGVVQEIVREVRPGEETEPRRLNAGEWRCPAPPAVPGAPEPVCRMTMALGPVPGGRLRLVFDDGANPPLKHLQVTVWRSRDDLVFPWPVALDPEVAAEVAPTLLVGNGEAGAPRYDLENLADALFAAPAAPAVVDLEGAAGDGEPDAAAGASAQGEGYAFLAAVVVASLALLAILRSQILGRTRRQS